MRPLVIYHGNCADGFSAAWCFWRKYGTGADYVAGVYQQDPPDVAGRDVYLVDFSYKRPVVEQMLKAANSVCLIDHHKTAIEDLQPLFMQDSWTGEPKQLAHFTDLNRSGATLAWDYLFPGEDRPLLLGHVEDRDLWRFKLAGTREIQAFVFSHEYSFELWDKLMSADQVELLKMTAAGALTYLLNPAAGKFAVASAVAFTAAAMVDWSVFIRLPGSWLRRANGSNVAGAAVDSLIFPTLAFGALMPHIVAMQFVAKVAGGAIWAWVLARTAQRATA